MKKYVVALLVTSLLACSDIDNKNSITVSKRQIDILPPSGLTLITPQMAELYKHYDNVNQAVAENSNGVLRVLSTYSMLSDLEDEKRQQERYCLLSNMVKLNNLPATQDVDKSMSATLRKGMQLISSQSVEEKNKQSEEYLKWGNSHEFVGYNENAFAVIQPVSVENDGESTSFLQAVGYIEVKGRILSTNCYADLNEQEWLSNTMLNWFIELDKANK